MTSPPRRRPVARVAEPLRGLEPFAVESASGRLAAWRLGEGPAVLLVHGFEDDNALWTPMLDMLAARGHAAVVLDLPGHGLSEGDERAVEAAPEAIAAVARALGPIDAVVGHSLGGWASAQAMADGLAAKRLVVIGAPFETTPARWRRVARKYGLDENVAERALALRAERLGQEARRPLPDILKTLASPTLVIHSRADERAPFEAAEAACADVENVHLIALEEANHRESAQDHEAIAAAVFFCER